MSSSRSPMRSVERALVVLSVLEQDFRPLRLTEVANRAGLPLSTTQRILGVLEGHDFVEREDSTYQLGVGMVALAHAFLMGNRLSRTAVPVLQELASATDQTASLFVRSGTHRIVVARVQGAHPLRYVLPIGERLPLHLGAGRVLAAGMADREVDALLEKVGEIQMDSGEKMDGPTFTDSLAAIRKSGYLVARSERVRGITSVSAPVYGSTAEMVGVVTLSFADQDIPDDRIDGLVLDVRLAARSIAQQYLAATATFSDPLSGPQDVK